jgi:hypothetical protein
MYGGNCLAEASSRADQPAHLSAVAAFAAATDNRYSPRDRSGRGIYRPGEGSDCSGYAVRAA